MEKFKICKLDDVADLKPYFTEDLTPEELKDAYAASKAAFTAADLQKFTEEDEGFFLEDLIADLKARKRSQAKDDA